jgi:hypothetical protein
MWHWYLPELSKADADYLIEHLSHTEVRFCISHFRDVVVWDDSNKTLCIPWCRSSKNVELHKESVGSYIAGFIKAIDYERSKKR